jgi:hypothetical protein
MFGKILSPPIIVTQRPRHASKDGWMDGWIRLDSIGFDWIHWIRLDSIGREKNQAGRDTGRTYIWCSVYS